MKTTFTLSDDQFQNEFCLKGVDFPCPSKVDFELMDGNLDGNLTKDEYMTFIQSN